MENSYKYEAFISYRHLEPDVTIAKNLHKMIETYKLPIDIKNKLKIKKMGKVFRDQDELPLVADLADGIRLALEESKWLIVICSPHLPLSKWCMSEVDYFIKLGRRDRILCVLIDGEPEDSFPPQLMLKLEENGEMVEREPFAADVRSDSIGKTLSKLRSEKLRIIAPMLGVDYDDLKKRARARFIKQAATIGATATILLFILVSVFMYQGMQAKLMNERAISSKSMELVTKSQTFRTEGQQSEAVKSALEALNMSEAIGLDNYQATGALYNAIVTFPTEAPFAKLYHSGEITKIVFSPDGEYLATLSNQNEITVWQVKYGKKAYSITLDRELVFEENERNEKIVDKVRFSFTKAHELVVLSDKKEGKNDYFVAKYDLGGNEVLGIPLEIYRTEAIRLTLFEEGNAIVVIGTNNYSGYNAENIALFLDIDTGKILQTYPLLSKAAAELSPDKKSLLLTHASKDLTLFAAVITADFVKTGKAAAEGSIKYRDPNASLLYIGDNATIIAQDKEIKLWDVKTGKAYPVGGLEYSTEGKRLLLQGVQNGEFLAGYGDAYVNQYKFSSNKVENKGKIFDVKNTWTEDTIYTFGWAEKDKNAIFYYGDRIWDSYTKYVTDAESIYQEYRVLRYPLSAGATSDNGYEAIAIKGSKVCEVYNIKQYPASYEKTFTKGHRQISPPYFDLSSGLLIAEGADEQGFFFSLNHFAGTDVTAEEKVYWPHSEGYDIYYDNQIYEKIMYGKENAVLYAPGGEKKYDIYVLKYKEAKLEKILELDGVNSLYISSLNDEGFICNYMMEDLTGVVSMYDFAGNKIGQPPELEKGYIYWNVLMPASSDNKMLYPLMKKDRTLEMALIDIAQSEIVKKEKVENIPITADTLIWSEDGSRFLIFNKGFNAAVYEAAGLKRIKEVKAGGNADITRVQYLGADKIAIFNTDNVVEFFDLATAETIFSSDKILGDISCVTYNKENGIAAVTTTISLDLYDLKNAKKFYGTIFFPYTYEPTDLITVHISDDARTLYFTVESSKREKENATTFYYNYSTPPLFDKEQLIKMAQEW